MTSTDDQYVDGYLFLTRARSLESLRLLRESGEIRAVARTVGGPHEVIVAFESPSIDRLPELYGRLGFDRDKGDEAMLATPVVPLNGGLRIFPGIFVLLAMVRAEALHEDAWHASYGRPSKTIGVSTVWGHSSATHLVEVTSDDWRGLNATMQGILSHDSVSLVTSYATGAVYMEGAGPRA